MSSILDLWNVNVAARIQIKTKMDLLKLGKIGEIQILFFLFTDQ